MTCLIAVHIRKFWFVLQICYLSYIRVSSQRSLSPCAQLLHLPVARFPYFLHLLQPVWVCALYWENQWSLQLSKNKWVSSDFHFSLALAILFSFTKRVFILPMNAHILLPLQAWWQKLEICAFFCFLGLPSGKFPLLGIAKILIWLHRFIWHPDSFLLKERNNIITFRYRSFCLCSFKVELV